MFRQIDSVGTVVGLDDLLRAAEVTQTDSRRSLKAHGSGRTLCLECALLSSTPTNVCLGVGFMLCRCFHAARYCSRACQAAHRQEHRPVCMELAAAAAAATGP